MQTATRPTVEFGVRPEPPARLSIAGFDPLEEPAQDDPSIKILLEESRKRDVLNILRSYTGTFDCFAEAIQNSWMPLRRQADSVARDIHHEFGLQ
jgi:hypothetical protein